jgi:hypothetical protein
MRSFIDNLVMSTGALTSIFGAREILAEAVLLNSVIFASRSLI